MQDRKSSVEGCRDSPVITQPRREGYADSLLVDLKVCTDHMWCYPSRELGWDAER
jgi:hypothetical protein